MSIVRDFPARDPAAAGRYDQPDLVRMSDYTQMKIAAAEWRDLILLRALRALR